VEIKIEYIGSIQAVEDETDGIGLLSKQLIVKNLTAVTLRLSLDGVALPTS